MTWIQQKIAPPTIIHCCGNVFTEFLPGNNRGINFTEPLPSIDKRDTCTDTQTDGRDL
jgi:hypothetical protein